MTVAKACGKIILLGEHAVVFGYPGIAAPVKAVGTTVTIKDIDSFSLKLENTQLVDHGKKIKKLWDAIAKHLKIKEKVVVTVNGIVPISQGMGSSASLAVAFVKALDVHFKMNLTKDEINKAAYEGERVFHGTPSGIDNTVIAFERPIMFKDGKHTFIKPKQPIRLVVATTGIVADTKEVVSSVRMRHKRYAKHTNALLKVIAKLVEEAKGAIENGDLQMLGRLMSHNHAALQKLHVSSKELDDLVNAAKDAGAYGAKLSGAGKGGAMVALVDNSCEENVIQSLRKAGAESVIPTVIS